MRVYVGADHCGYDWLQLLIEYLAHPITRGAHYDVHNMGAYEYDEEDDYNDPAIAVAKAVRDDPGSMGILICGSAHGMTMQANRFKGIRAAHCSSLSSVTMAREHDDANILCMSAEELDEDLMERMADTFFLTDFDSFLERRVRRVNRLDERKDYD